MYKSQFICHIYTPIQKYWNSEANSFIFAVDWKHLGLTSKDEYETFQLLFTGIFISIW